MLVGPICDNRCQVCVCESRMNTSPPSQTPLAFAYWVRFGFWAFGLSPGPGRSTTRRQETRHNDSYSTVTVDTRQLLDSYSTQLLDRIARQSLTATQQTSTATRQKPPDSMRLGVKVSSSTARPRPRQNSTDLDRAEPIRTSLLEPHSFKVKVDGDPLVKYYTTWWLDDGFTSGGPFVPRSVCSFVLFLT